MADVVDTFPSKEALDSAMADVPTQEDQDLAALAPEERAIGRKLLPGLVARITQQAEAKKAQKLTEEIDRLRADNEKNVREAIERIQKSLAPPDESQLEKLLSQEYKTFPIKVQLHGKPGAEPETKTFTIVELPQYYEKRITEIVANKLVPFMKDVQAIDFRSSSTLADRITKVITLIPETFDTLAEVAAISIDPDGTTYNAEWVQKNISSVRIAAIVEAQFTVNKLRDFFSAAYRLIPH